jgi:hypothetical protein
VCATVGQFDFPLVKYRTSLICNKFFMCGRYRLSRRKQVVEEYSTPIQENKIGIPYTTSTLPRMSPSSGKI